MVRFSLPDGPHPLPIKQRQLLVNVRDAILQNIRRGKKLARYRKIFCRAGGGVRVDATHRDSW